MSIDGALKARLEAHAGLIALIGTRSYAGKLEQNATLPAVRYSMVSGPRVHAWGRDTGLVESRWQFDAIAITRDGARLVAVQLKAALNRWGATLDGTTVDQSLLENELDDYDDDVKQFRRILEFVIHFRE